MVEVAYASMPIVPTFPPDFARRLDAGSQRAMLLSGQKGGALYGAEAGKAAGTRFGSAFRNAVKIGAVGGGFALFAGLKESNKEASDLNESLNAVRVTYGKQAGEVIRLGGRAARQVGLSRTEFQGLSVQYSNFVKSISKADGRKPVKVLDDLTTRVADFASVMNLDVDEAARLFQSGLAGETEPLRRYGIDLSATSVAAFSIAEGLTEAGAVMTDQQKVQARYAFLMEQTSRTQGDFKNTSDELANQQRILSGRFDNTQAKLGKALLPIMTDVVTFLNRKGIPAFKDFLEFAGDHRDDLGRLTDRLKPLADETLPAFASAFGDIRDFAKDALPYAEDLIEAFNDLPDGVKKGLIIGGGALAANRILRGEGGGGGRGILSGGRGTVAGAIRGGVIDRSGQLIADRLLRRFQTPIPVIVMNPGFGGAGGGGKPGVPPVVPGAVPKGPVLPAVPWWARVGPVVPGGTGQNSAFYNLTGKEIPLIGGKGRDSGNELVWPGGVDADGNALPIEQANEMRDSLVGVGKQVDANREAINKFITELDKTPRQVKIRMLSEGTQQILDEARAIAAALAAAGAGGVPNTPGEATPRGFGDGSGVFAGANINIRANDMRDTDRQLRDRARRAARAGFR